MTDRGDLISGVIGTHVFRHVRSVKQYQIVQEESLSLLIKVVPIVARLAIAIFHYFF